MIFLVDDIYGRVGFSAIGSTCRGKLLQRENEPAKEVWEERPTSFRGQKQFVTTPQPVSTLECKRVWTTLDLERCSAYELRPPLSGTSAVSNSCSHSSIGRTWGDQNVRRTPTKRNIIVERWTGDGGQGNEAGWRDDISSSGGRHLPGRSRAPGPEL